MSSAFRTFAVVAVVAFATVAGAAGPLTSAARASDTPAKADPKDAPAKPADPKPSAPASAKPADPKAPPPAKAADAKAADAKAADAKAAAPTVLPTPKALPPELSGECAWIGKRIVSLLARDDVEQSRRFMEFYRLFACKERHIAPAFRCVINDTDAPEGEEMTARVDRCWEAAAD